MEKGVIFNISQEQKNICKNILCAGVAIQFLFTANTISECFDDLNIVNKSYVYTDNEYESYEYNNSFVLEQLQNISPDKEENLQQINDISLLEDNWNGYGAKKFSMKVIEFARRIIDNLFIQPEVFPTGRNSIQIEYDKSNGDYLELELFEDNTIKLFVLYANGENKTENISFDDINKVVDDFYGSRVFFS